MLGTFLGHWELFLRTVLFWELFLRIFNYEIFTVFHGNLFLSSFLVFLPSNMVSNSKSIIQQIKIFLFLFFAVQPLEQNLYVCSSFITV